MCSVGDDVEDQVGSKFMQENLKFKLTENKCTKCRTQQPQVLLYSRYPYCKDCFIMGSTHKFKALLGKNRVVHPNDNVLICYQAGHPSTALLSFLRNGLNLTTPKKLKFNPVIIYVENHHYLPLHARKAILQQVREEVSKFSFPLYFISLIEYMVEHNQLTQLLQKDFEKVTLNEDDIMKLKQLIKKKGGTLTIQEEILNIHQQQLLTEAAKYLECKCIFTPEIGIDIASKLLTNVSLGRGAQLQFDIGTIDARDDKVKLVKPLRQFTMKELAFYNVFNELEPVSFLQPLENPYSSVQNLIKKFVSDLQLNYPATISTVVRTGDKLTTDKSNEQHSKCLLCKAPIEIKTVSLQSGLATQFSHWVSTQSCNSNLPVDEHTKILIETFNESRNAEHCFACSQIIEFL